MTRQTSPVETCEICGATGRKGSHPCRFERACACWHGTPCKAATAAKGKAQR